MLEQKARQTIDKKLIESGWLIQDFYDFNPSAALGVAVREHVTDSGPVDYSLFIKCRLCGLIEAKKDDWGEKITEVEDQTRRYANSVFKNVDPIVCTVRFVYEATGQITQFTDYQDQICRSRRVYTFHRPKTLEKWIREGETIRNHLRNLPILEKQNLRDCQF
ncbi:type III restriction enzyme, res subunit [Candidatus Mycoplasma haematolamae str. Purdue]|uniref:Type III restriction enzyme, res subunit n=1 Tax=Mycoplasma haematolamae (strain Purdue) TaxID=1212765 RepID=I7CJW1_MYCHA|nr:hypothetical protein [Candidatus Mycoplasma haematolamae]AFO52164.1 type III restriction enzyme, res subunit [Candidatus Mycoplasma haematolamae str. Purdue]